MQQLLGSSIRLRLADNGRNCAARLRIQRVSAHLQTLDLARTQQGPIDSGASAASMTSSSAYAPWYREIAYYTGLVVLERVGCKEFAGFTKVEGNFLAVLKRVQECFPKELADLKAGGALKRTSVLLSFTPFLYTDELIRTGGSLEGSPLPYQYPVLLPAQHPLSKRIAKELLCRLKHSGTDAVFSAIRQHFWMVQGRQLAKGVRRSCGLCIKQSTRSGQHLMAGLPIERLAIDCALSPHIR
ncbi:hypothetical protein M514_12575 [Trichuris suis]|uniref:Integrase zinc-binding domain-containing protein n=1 Tax=Trichuris suis TaxID=68888 RepID=A0A085N6I4_9BILA|nr:hypothetical protein M514_12575 [Trichuris suis]